MVVNLSFDGREAAVAQEVPAELEDLTLRTVLIERAFKGLQKQKLRKESALL